jgi:hypothetical protein
MEKKNNKTLTLQKIPLESLIEILANLYNKGADYIDVTGTSNDGQDVISINVREEYMMDDEEEEEENNLSDEDLTQLI